MMKKIQPANVFRALFYFVLTYFLYYQVHSGAFRNHIHIKFKPLLILAGILFFLMGVVSFFNGTKFRIRKQSSIAFMLLLLPLLIYSYPERTNVFPPVAMGTAPLTTGTESLTDEDSDEMLRKAIAEASKMDSLDEVVPDYQKMTDWETFVSNLEYIYQHPELEGEEIELVGLLFHFKEGTPRPFFCGRMLMFCCAADAMPIGFFLDHAGSLEEYQGWVHIKGTIHFETKEEHYLMLKVKEIRRAPAEENIYVYPPTLF